MVLNQTKAYMKNWKICNYNQEKKKLKFYGHTIQMHFIRVNNKILKIKKHKGQGWYVKMREELHKLEITNEDCLDRK